MAEMKIPYVGADLFALIKAPERTAYSGNGKGGDGTPDELEEMLRGIPVEWFRPGGKHGNYAEDGFFHLMASAHYYTRGEGEDVFVRYCATDPEYADAGEQVRDQWRALDSKRDGDVVTHKYLFKLLREAGRHDLQKPPKHVDDFKGVPIDAKFETDSAPERATTPSIIARRGKERGLRVSGSGRAEDSYSNALVAVSMSGLQPARNEMTQTVVFRNPHWDVAKHGEVLNDSTMRIIRAVLSEQLQGNAYEPSEKHVYDAVMAIADAHRFNPVLDYLESLVWDGVPRLDRLFVDYFPCGDAPYTRAVSAVFGIGAVRRVREPGCKLDTMPVVRGPQGWGKSSGIAGLAGPNYYSDADLGSLSDKDAPMKLRGIWIQEFAEINALSKHDVGVLKAFMSRAVDRQRDPYARNVEDHPRRCVFLGTVNEGGYLKDHTGARRFLPLDLIGRVDLVAIRRDRDQLWAEAVFREAEGESHVLPESLWSEAADRQRAQTADDPWADTIREFLAYREREWGRYNSFFEPDPSGFEEEPPPPDRVHSVELLEALGIPTHSRTQGHSQRLRTIMEAVLGWTHVDNVKVQGRQGKGYLRPDG